MERKSICKILCLVFILQLFQGVGVESFFSRALAQSSGDTMTMTRFWNNGAMDVNVPKGCKVTISNKEELEFLLRYICKEEFDSVDVRKTTGVTFFQTQDIKISDFNFSYEEEFGRIAIWKDGVICGAIDSDMNFYKGLENTHIVTSEEIGLDEAKLNLGEAFMFCTTTFSGNYDGNGHSISGLWMNNENYACAGLFGSLTSDAAVKNLKMEQILCMGNSNGGVVAYDNEGTVKQCTFSHVFACGNGCGLETFGCVVECNSGAVLDCSVNDSAFATKGVSDGCGSIARLNLNGRVERCLVKNVSYYGEYHGGFFGGVIGRAESDNGGTSIVRDCTVQNMKIHVAADAVGGIVGAVRATKGNVQIEHCCNEGIELNTDYLSYLGGILGYAEGEVYVSDCSNYSDFENDFKNHIIPELCYGGIVGRLDHGEVRNCSNYGDISFSHYIYEEVQHDIGGIVGLWYDCSKSRIVNCYNQGAMICDINYHNTVGGIIGKVTNCEEDESVWNPAVNCVNAGVVQGETTGWLAGSGQYGKFVQCYGMEGTAGQAFGDSGQAENCGIYEHFNLDMLNAWVAAQDDEIDYLNWEETESGTPILVETYEIPNPSGPVMATPTPISTITPDPIFTPTPTRTPIAMPTASTPTSTQSSIVTPVPTAVATTPAIENPLSSLNTDDVVMPSPVSVNSMGTLTEKKLSVTGVTIYQDKKGNVTLRWKANPAAQGYRIERSVKKKSGYRLCKLVKSQRSFTDTCTKGGKKYYYRICAYATQKAKYVQGKQKQISITTLYEAPTLSLSKGSFASGEKYLQIQVGKAKGDYVEVYFQTGMKFRKMPLKNNSLSYYHGKLKLSYQETNRIRCKVRIYTKKKGKKYYSSFSTIRKIRL